MCIYSVIWTELGCPGVALYRHLQLLSLKGLVSHCLQRLEVLWSRDHFSDPEILWGKAQNLHGVDFRCRIRILVLLGHMGQQLRDISHHHCQTERTKSGRYKGAAGDRHEKILREFWFLSRSNFSHAQRKKTFRRTFRTRTNLHLFGRTFRTPHCYLSRMRPFLLTNPEDDRPREECLGHPRNRAIAIFHRKTNKLILCTKHGHAQGKRGKKNEPKGHAEHN